MPETGRLRADIQAQQLNSTQLNSTQLHSTQLNATQRNATQRNSTQLHSTQVNPTQPNPTQPSATQRNATQRNSTQLNSTQPNPTQPNPTQLNSTQLNSTQLNSTQLFRTELLTGDVADTRQQTVFNMLPKTRDAKSTSDFRPIAVVNCKTFAYMVLGRKEASLDAAAGQPKNNMDSEPVDASKRFEEHLFATNLRT